MNNIESVIGPDRQDPSPGRGLVAGLVGGLAGCVAMAAFQSASSWALGSAMVAAEDDVAGDGSIGSGEPSTIRGARAIARQVGGVELAARHRRAAGHAFHFAFGAGLGAAYGVLVEYVRIASIGSGVPFGALQVVFADELSVPALGLSESPSKAPASAHLRALAAHVVFGLVTEQVRRAIRGDRRNPTPGHAVVPSLTPFGRTFSPSKQTMEQVGLVGNSNDR